MNYQVLARKWRPQTFSDVVGQEHVLTALKNSLLSGRIHHAYLLSGTRGIGKTTIARLLAKGLNCNFSTSIPCGKCNNCKEIEYGRFIDLIEIDAASRTKVEDTREILENIQYAPTRGKFKIYIIDEVHVLSKYSFNALLKTLEEPPSHVKFLLATTDPQKLPTTILSRCLQFHLKLLSIEQIYHQLLKILKKENVIIEKHALQILSKAANGSMRDALSLTDQAIAIGMGKINVEIINTMLGIPNIDQPLSIIESISNGNSTEMMEQIEKCSILNIDWENLLIEMLTLLHHIAIGQLIPDKLNDKKYLNVIPRLKLLANNITPKNIQLYYKILLTGRKELSFSPDHKMGVEMTLLRAITFRSNNITCFVKDNKKKNNLCKNNTKFYSLTIKDKSKNFYNINNNVISNMENNNYYEFKENKKPITFLNYVNTSICDNKKKVLITNKISLNNCGIKKSLINNKIYPFYNYNENEKKNILKLRNIDSSFNISESSESTYFLQDSIINILKARSILLQYKKNKKIKKNETIIIKKRKNIKSYIKPIFIKKQKKNIENYNQSIVNQSIKKNFLETETTTLLYSKKMQSILLRNKENLENNSWAEQINRLIIPKLIYQFALNTWKENLSPYKICLHLRSKKSYLNSITTRNILKKALSNDLHTNIELTIIEDDNLSINTPLEWYKIIYEKKIIQSKKEITTNSHIKIIKSFFNAKIYENSIQFII